jgi:hypothetical protein
MRTRILLAAILFAVVAAGTSWAQTGYSSGQSQSSPSSVQTVTGTVTSLSDEFVVITTSSGSTMNFTTDQRSRLPSDVAIGRKVRIAYVVDPQGNYHADKVSLLGALGVSGASIRPAAAQSTPAGSSAMAPTDQGMGDQPSSSPGQPDEPSGNPSGTMGVSPSGGTMGNQPDTQGSPSDNSMSSPSGSTTGSQTSPAAGRTSGTEGTLPRTASPLPLIGVAGVLALAAAGGLRLLQR